MQRQPLANAAAAGPYRAGGTAEALRPAGTPSPPTLAVSRLMDAVCLDLHGNLTTPKTTVLHVVMTIVVIGPAVAYVIGLFYGGPVELIVLVVLFGGLFGWVWRRGVRGNRIGALINDGRIDAAEHMIGSSSFGLEIPIGLCAQLRGDHGKAASAFRAALAIVERRPGYMQPIHMQGYPREAIALANLGRVPEAHARLAQLPSGGEYLEALRLVTWSYLTLIRGEPIPANVVAALEQTFLPVRGSWGGLALAAYGRDRLGDHAAAQQLLSEERARSGSDALPAVMPHLAAYAQQRARS